MCWNIELESLVPGPVCSRNTGGLLKTRISFLLRRAARVRRDGTSLRLSSWREISSVVGSRLNSTGVEAFSALLRYSIKSTTAPHSYPKARRCSDLFWLERPVHQLSNMTQIYTRPPISPARERPSPHEQRSMNDSFCVKPLQQTHEYSENYRPPARSSWELHSPMSAPEKAPFEAPVPKAGEMYAKRPESRQNSSREQLPPLSSLFWSSSPHHTRTAPFPYVERRSPVFPAASTLDARYPATPIHPERHYDTSYFQRPGSARPYAYESRPESRERLGLPTSPHPVHVGEGAESPRHESQHGPNEGSRPRHPSALSPRLQGSVLEYFGRDASLRPHPEHRPLPPQVPRPEAETRPAYRDSAHSTPATPNYPPTPASTVAGESATPKDGLGPKIWTGTQFLPRFVRQADVPGEGTCYFYDDGTHCKTVIDGEIVNAHWGVTKAGKPRKRLAIACITCREKKIKCDPDYPRCVQCEKFGRTCKFKNA